MEMNIVIGNEPGWLGGFTRYQAPGALPNGTRIMKARAEEGDATPLGLYGVVLGSLPGDLAPPAYSPTGELIRYLYFVEWDNRLSVAIGVADWKLSPAFAPCFICPRCRTRSSNPTDLKEGYCGACHDWTGA